MTFETPTIRRASWRLVGVAAAALLALLIACAHDARAATAPQPPSQDPFYVYTGSTPLSSIAPGTVLGTRTVKWHVAGIPLPVNVVQLQYRSTNALGAPVANVTSVLLPPIASLLTGASTRLVGYGSFYDSTTSDDEPSYAFSGAPFSEGRALTTVETGDLAALLLAGDTVSVADTEGQTADFAAGPEYGMLTLDGLRAAIQSPATRVSKAAKVALMGYSGGAIATGWAAQLAPSYAPDINQRLVGATLGGVLVDPDHNLHYVEGSSTWAGVMPMALVGVSRAYGIDLTPYLSAYGQQVEEALQATSIDNAESDFSGITWQQIAKPQFAEPESVPAFVSVANKLILGHDALPTVPLQITQGDQGELDGTANDQAGIGPGDGVMIAGDVRTYAREACAVGDPVQYTEVPLTHETAEPVWSAQALPWLSGRFAGKAAPQDCSSIAVGNPLTPVPQP